VFAVGIAEVDEGNDRLRGDGDDGTSNEPVAGTSNGAGASEDIGAGLVVVSVGVSELAAGGPVGPKPGCNGVAGVDVPYPAPVAGTPDGRVLPTAYSDSVLSLCAAPAASAPSAAPPVTSESVAAGLDNGAPENPLAGSVDGGVTPAGPGPATPLVGGEGAPDRPGGSGADALGSGKLGAPTGTVPGTGDCGKEDKGGYVEFDVAPVGAPSMAGGASVIFVGPVAVPIPSGSGAVACAVNEVPGGGGDG